jgi:phenylacetate-CoA ligase
VTIEPPGFDRARDTFRRAALEVPAYADFLRRNKVVAERIRTPLDFASVPPVTKANYLHQYPLNMLARHGDIAEAGTWSTSSGSSGKPAYWPRGAWRAEVLRDLIRAYGRSIGAECPDRCPTAGPARCGRWYAERRFRCTSVRSPADAAGVQAA